MKKTAKILLGSGFALLLSAGAVVNFLQSSRAEAKVSDLTLANIEALALDNEKPEKPVSIPCCPAEKSDVCTFSTVNGDGTQGSVSINGMRNC